MKPPLKNKLIIIHWNKFCHALFMDHKKYFYLFFISAIAGFISSCTDENELITRDKYIGTWTCKETQAGLAPTTFTIRMEALGSEDSLYVYNFDNLGQNERALFIVSSSSVVIPAQSVTGFTISGSGILSGNKLNMDYTVDSDNYSAECTK